MSTDAPSLLALDDARARILREIRLVPAERMELGAALGRILAAPVSAREAAPPFTASSMDGWAVDSRTLDGADEQAPVLLSAAGEARAGGPMPGPLEPGTARRIFTGAPLPDGADAVVMQEHVVRDGSHVRFVASIAPGTNVRAAGEDVAAGASLLAAGTLLGGGELAVLASQGIATVDVRRRPRVAILTNGDELRDVGEPARPGSIVDCNAPMLAALVREAGGEAVVVPRAPDDLPVLTERVREALGYDALVLAGGVSVGDHDLVHVALRDVGVEARFWKVAIKPGKPLTFGLHDATPVFGLPGNPVSAWVTFELFVRPALRAMLGDPRPFRPSIDVELDRDVRHPRDRTEFVRASLEWRSDAPPLAHVFARQGSGTVTSIANVDALVELVPSRSATRRGERARAVLLRAAH